MSYSLTSRLGLAKADPGTNQAFETTVFNDNLDLVDAEFVAVDGRLDVLEGVNPAARLTAVEAKNVEQDGRLTTVEGRAAAIEAANWVTNVRMADNSVGSAELIDGSVVESKLPVSLDLTGKTVLVAAGDVNESSPRAASTFFVTRADGNVYSQAVAAANDFTSTNIASNNLARNLPAKIQAGVRSATTDGSGLITITFGSAFASVPVVVCSLLAPAGGTSGTFIAALQSVSTTAATVRIYNQAGSVSSSVAVQVHWQAMAY